MHTNVSACVSVRKHLSVAVRRAAGETYGTGLLALPIYELRRSDVAIISLLILYRFFEAQLRYLLLSPHSRCSCGVSHNIAAPAAQFSHRLAACIARILNSQFSILHSQFSILNFQFTDVLQQVCLPNCGLMLSLRLRW